ncbi:MAG: hypothetical protein LBS58_00645 [Coriobacteriales bacterium]|jgi:hypothetical protein|nr:hypothetical protein [Coriobacteriales bacterium]
MKKKRDKAEVVILESIQPPPEPHEVSAAWILARHYNCAIEFLKPLDGYKHKTPDFVMRALQWEVKSPKGNSKRNIRDKLSNAKTQSPNIILDARRSKLSDAYIESELRKQVIVKKSIYRLLMITKAEIVIEIKL